MWQLIGLLGSTIGRSVSGRSHRTEQRQVIADSLTEAAPALVALLQAQEKAASSLIRTQVSANRLRELSRQGRTLVETMCQRLPPQISYELESMLHRGGDDRHFCAYQTLEGERHRIMKKWSSTIVCGGAAMKAADFVAGVEDNFDPLALSNCGAMEFLAPVLQGLSHDAKMSMPDDTATLGGIAALADVVRASSDARMSTIERELTALQSIDTLHLAEEDLRLEHAAVRLMIALS
jgi:hypothetical protein